MGLGVALEQVPSDPNRIVLEDLLGGDLLQYQTLRVWWVSPKSRTMP